MTRFYISKWITDKKTTERITLIKEVSFLHWLWYKFATTLDLDIHDKYIFGGK